MAALGRSFSPVGNLCRTCRGVKRQGREISMRINPGAVAMAAFIVGAVGLSGCATKGFVRQNVAVVDQKVTADRSRMDTMDQATRDAMARAEAAGKLAEGKF